MGWPGMAWQDPLVRRAATDVGTRRCRVSKACGFRILPLRRLEGALGARDGVLSHGAARREMVAGGSRRARVLLDGAGLRAVPGSDARRGARETVSEAAAGREPHDGFLSRQCGAALRRRQLREELEDE